MEHANANKDIIMIVEFVDLKLQIVDMVLNLILQPINAFVNFLNYGFMENAKLFPFVRQMNFGMDKNVFVNGDLSEEIIIVLK